jgi:uncharacterized membrane protein
MNQEKTLKWFHPRSLFDKFFSVGIIIKGIDGLIELIIGFVLLFVTPESINRLAVFATHRELAKDPHDFIANTLLHASNGFTNGGRVFLIVYLWVHAAIKLVAVIGILKNQLWAYPFSLITLGILTMYQVYEIVFVKVSFVMVSLTVMDVIILWMIWEEYLKIRLHGFAKSH